MECSIPPLTLSKGLMHQQDHLKEAVSLAIKGDMDMSIVAKHNVIFPCHSSLLVLFSPFIARLLSEVPCCPSPTIFLPDFKKIHITKLLHLLESGQAISGQNVNADIETITEIAKVLQISVNDISIGPYLDNPLGDFQIKKEENNFNVKAEIKQEFEASNEKQENESLIDKQCEEMEECEYIEKEDTKKTPFGETIKIEVAKTFHSEVSSGMETNDEEDMIEKNTEVIDKDKTSDGLENKDRREQTEQVIGEVPIKTNVEEDQERKSRQNGLGFISSVTFPCELCPQKFKTSRQLKEHKMNHTGDKPFSCDFCPKMFKKCSHLKEHTMIHNGVKPFLCDICPKRFTKSSNLKEHTRIHTGDRPFPCEICTKRFTASGDLKRHTKIHTGEKPFQCRVCLKKFGRASHLKSHTKIHTEPERNISIE